MSDTNARAENSSKQESLEERSERDESIAKALEALEEMEPVLEETVEGGSELSGEDFFEPFLLLGKLKPLVRDLIEKNRKLEREVRQKNRLKVLGEMASCLAHEIRTPLSAVHLNLDRLREKTDNNADVRELVDRIDDGLQNVQDLVNDILTYSRDIDPIPSRFHWQDLVDDVLEGLSRKKKKNGVQVDVDIDDELPPVRGDREKLQRVLNNVVLNAMQAVGEDGRVFVRSWGPGDDEDGRERFRTEVVDNGPGIPDEIMDQLFTPFESKKTKGTGLGLAIASRIVKAHNGSIRGENRSEEQGARFVFDLPLRFRGDSGEENRG